jgi:hypothetical protein
MSLAIVAFLESLLWLLLGLIIALFIDGLRFGYQGLKNLWRMLR